MVSSSTPRAEPRAQLLSSLNEVPTVGQMSCTLKASTEPGKPAGVETSALQISRVKGDPGRELELGESWMEIRDTEGTCGPEEVSKASVSSSRESTEFHWDLVF